MGSGDGCAAASEATREDTFLGGEGLAEAWGSYSGGLQAARGVPATDEAHEATASRGPDGVERRPGGPGQAPRAPSMLCLLDALGALPELTAVSGVDEAGLPVLLPLKSRRIWNLLITGAASSGKSEWLRALAVSLALTSAPEKLQIAGLDLGGRELGVLESLPHTVAELATSLDTAHDLLVWLNSEMDRRLRGTAQKPDLALVVDDLGWGDQAAATSAGALLGRLWAHGWQAGIHILAAGLGEPLVAGGTAARGRAVPGRLGWFELTTGHEYARVRACGLSAWELDHASRRLGVTSRDVGAAR